jgi:polyhydroxyalkanoate synthesis regulator phasin
VRDEVRRIALFASGVGDLTRHRAEQIAKELVKSGEVRRDQAAGWAKMLFDASRENRQEITRFIRSEMQNQVKGLGLATKSDLDRLERRVDRVEASARLATRRKTTANKSAAKKAVAKKTVAKKSAARKEGPVGTSPSQLPTEGAGRHGIDPTPSSP